jgi:hypothetical protein
VDNDGDLDIVEVWCSCYTTIPALFTSLPVVEAHLNQTIRRKACAGTATTLGVVCKNPADPNLPCFEGFVVA